MTKFRMCYDKDKVAEWLNRMAEQGWAMTGYFLGFYRFAKCEPGEYVYQVDIAENLFNVSEDYRQFMEELGVEVMCLWGPWVILRRKAEEGSFVMYSDVESTIAHYTKVGKVFWVCGVLECVSVLLGICGAVLGKNVVGWGTAFAAAMVLLLLLRQIVRLNGILAELNARLGRKTSKPGGFSSALVSGIRTGGAIIGLLCAVFLYLLLYSGLHELGHCIAVWICGGTVTGFYLFDPQPYMTYEGITGSLPRALVSIAGSVLPLMAVAAVLLFYKESKKHPRLDIYVGAIAGLCILPVMNWIVEPVYCLLNRIKPDSDVYKVINETGLHPAAVTLCAIIVFALMCLLLVKRIPRLFGWTSGKNFIIFVAALAIALTAVDQGVTMLFEAYRITAKGNIQYTVEGSQDSILQEEFAIEIRQPGEYVLYAEWEVDRDGVIAAVVFQDEDEVYYDCTGAVYLDLESLPVYLDSGSYTLSFYLLSSEEDWLEYCRIAGEDPDVIVDFPYQADAPATVTGSYRFLHKR